MAIVFVHCCGITAMQGNSVCSAHKHNTRDVNERIVRGWHSAQRNLLNRMESTRQLCNFRWQLDGWCVVSMWCRCCCEAYSVYIYVCVVYRMQNHRMQAKAYGKCIVYISFMMWRRRSLLSRKYIVYANVAAVNHQFWKRHFLRWLSSSMLRFSPIIYLDNI